MIEKLDRYKFRKESERYIQQQTRDRHFVTYKSAKTVMLLFQSDVNEENVAIKALMKQLVADGKKVVAWGFVDKKEVVSPILSDLRILNKKNVDFFQRPQQAFMRELEGMRFDLLLDISVKEILPLRYLGLYANAYFKAGTRSSDPQIYDFVLDIQNMSGGDDTNSVQSIDATFIYNQIIFYLKSIQTSD